ncbi:MAG TPA: quinolinate synthase NadA, partial [Patescibacteria group bacterium]|nr:quinolinate synthase NadA [Patescibacteria group bacterium]
MLMLFSIPRSSIDAKRKRDILYGEYRVHIVNKEIDMNSKELGELRYGQFSRFADDLYPGRYTPEFCQILAEQEIEIRELKREKQATILAHNYLYPEFHEIADKVGDSLGLSLFVQAQGATRVDFQSVAFMGQTAKMIVGDKARVYIPDYPEVLGCSLVFGTDYAWLLQWKEKTGGIIISYINSDPYTKSISEYIGTSSNFDRVILRAAKDYPGRKILLAPDRFLGYVMKAKAVRAGVPRDLIDVYEYFKIPHRASCYVHENIPHDAIEIAMVDHPE